MLFRACPDCGAHLDPCERCDCKEKAASSGANTESGNAKYDGADYSTEKEKKQVNVPDNLKTCLAAQEKRDADLDRRRGAYPICRCCGHSIFGCETYRQIGNYYICGDCDSISEVGYTNDLEV